MDINKPPLCGTCAHYTRDQWSGFCDRMSMGVGVSPYFGCLLNPPEWEPIYPQYKTSEAVSHDRPA